MRHLNSEPSLKPRYKIQEILFYVGFKILFYVGFLITNNIVEVVAQSGVTMLRHD